jgi:hypothetical protein
MAAFSKKLGCLFSTVKPSQETLESPAYDLRQVPGGSKRLQELTSQSKQWTLATLGKPTLPAKEDRRNRLEQMMERLLGG